ncbi:hypothetical protein HanOQP8_Chr06g0229011 [Helianthus annuus]|nr:hypothetical protein HanOQP8_Chr06g0229011 [Helianthus annuus]
MFQFCNWLGIEFDHSVCGFHHMKPYAVNAVKYRISVKDQYLKYRLSR